MLATDLHVHLYGCLTPEDIWELAKDSWRNRTIGLRRWADGMMAATGEEPDWQSFWKDESGLQALAEFWLCRPNDSRLLERFAAFEARFGLSIALFPISFARDDLRVLRRVMNRHRDEGRHFVEYRFVYPPDRQELANYSLKDHLDQLCQAMADFEADNGGAFEPRLAISLSRDAATAVIQYRNLKAWQQSTKPSLKRHLTAIDFSGYEEVFDLNQLRGLCGEVLRDNAGALRMDVANDHAASEDALAILIHAGETMEQADESGNARVAALRRVQLAAEMGAHRIGHAVVLSSNGLRDESELLAREQAVAAVKGSGCVIESCISSNLVVSGVKKLADHPLPEFLEMGLPVTLATDDPGIFATNSQREFDLAVELIGAPKAEQICRKAALYKSEILSGRKS